MTPPLETLPLTILEDICGYLAQCDGFKKRRSLWAFSLTNRWCCAAAAAQRFSQIQLTVSGPDKLKADLQCWTNILTMHNRFRHVRRLNVVGPVEENNSVKKQPDAPVGGQEGREEDTYDGLDDVDDVDDFNYYFTDIRDYFDMHDFCKPSKTSFDHPAQGISEDTEGSGLDWGRDAAVPALGDS
ncbi:hypothetical protein NKR23_g9521 [Pleurostoma richardsiae]|uniref:Uncharacterized protein n=1 Tax=Pleurostoma richardsiae TaxID=41990 RepID=A0AA38R6M4_9PEZI|nr:hypothetical protein NKR23_g9521 [Pleurostoma richardsiae]